MKTKIVYVLVSNPSDIYLEQAYISMYSAKYYMPDVHITLITDNHTEKTFFDVIRKKELCYVDELIVVDLDSSFTAQKRSRVLKTSVRKYIKGDFLFIDCDTIIVKPLYEIDQCQADIAACWDTHALFRNNPFRDMCLKHTKKIGCSIENEDYYFNSGIIYVKETPLTHDFYKQWNKYYLEGYSNGIAMDQPSFAKTNIQMNHVVQTLDDIWNCELKYGVKFLNDAKIVHYLCTNKSKTKDSQLFLLNDKSVLEEIKKTGIINKAIKQIIIDPFKGIARTTHSFAGQDLFLLRTDAFTLLSRMFNNPYLFAGINYVSYLILSILKLPSFIKRKYIH